SGCTPDQTAVDENTMPPDMAMSLPPPPPCQKDDVRCNADYTGTEVCDGMSWNPGVMCNDVPGSVCLGGVCKTPCDLAPRGNVGCSFYPVNLWSTSTDGDFGIVVTNTSDTLTAVVSLEDVNGPVKDIYMNDVTNIEIKPAMSDPKGGIYII